MSRRRKSTPPAGSLRETLVEAAAALIAKKGPQGFSLREVARRAHVSEAAPYWHFTDREALLAAVAERGFVEMAKGMMTIWAAVADPRERLHALGIGYVQFALAHPSYLRVMFGSEVPDKAAHPALEGSRRAHLRSAGAGHRRLPGGRPGAERRSGGARRGRMVHRPWPRRAARRRTAQGTCTVTAEAERLAERVTEVLRTGLAPR